MAKQQIKYKTPKNGLLLLSFCQMFLQIETAVKYCSTIIVHAAVPACTQIILAQILLVLTHIEAWLELSVVSLVF